MGSPAIATAMVATLGACAATGPHLAVQSARVGSVRVVAFGAQDAVDSIVSVLEGTPTMALALSDGDWLVELDHHALARISSGGAIRWTRELAIDQAIEAAPDLIVARSYNEEGPSLVGLRADGAIAWRLDEDSILASPIRLADGRMQGSPAKLVRVPGATVAVSSIGELAVDDSGARLWRRERDDKSSAALAMYVDGIGVAIVSAAPRAPMVLRVVDAATGRERSHAQLVPNGGAWSLEDVAAARRSVVVHALDDGSSKYLVFDTTPDALTFAATIIEDDSVEELPALPSIAASDAIFGGHSVTGIPSLFGITLVDTVRRRVRRVPVLRLTTSSVRIRRSDRMRDTFTVVGDFQGTLHAGRRTVRTVSDLRAERGDMHPRYGAARLSSLCLLAVFRPR